MVLEFIAEQMEDLEIPYAYYEWIGEPPLTYFVGEYVEAASYSEDGEVDGEITLSGFTRGSYANLKDYRDKIYTRFRNGERYTRNNNGIIVYYSHAITVPTGIEDVKRLDITLTCREWSN